MLQFDILFGAEGRSTSFEMKKIGAMKRRQIAGKKGEFASAEIGSKATATAEGLC